MKRESRDDLRSRARVPYGYRIENGKAVIDSGEATALRHYFRAYLDGLSMAKAAEQAELPCSASTLKYLLFKKEYTGTDFYPQIITEEYQKRLAEEYEIRKTRSVRVAPKIPKKGVKIFSEFKLAEARLYNSGDPADCAAAFYGRIIPRTKENEIDIRNR